MLAVARGTPVDPGQEDQRPPVSQQPVDPPVRHLVRHVPAHRQREVLRRRQGRVDIPAQRNEERHGVIPSGQRTPDIGNDFHYQIVAWSMSRSTLRPVVKLRSTAGTGYTYVTRKSRRNNPDRLVVRKYDPVIGSHVEFREER